MLKATHDQLGEARFFYQHLLTSGSSYSVRHDPREFRYYFSAFIRAARSVLWVAHYEEKDKWKAWEPGWKNRLTDEERELLDFTNELRLDEEKRAGANTHVGWEEIAIDDLVKSANFELERSHPAYGVHVFAPPGVPLPKARRPAYYFEQKDGKQEVTALCDRYLKFLEKVVAEFERSI
jgi:hypothetical protein